MAKISKTADAPEGVLRVSIGTSSFKVEDDSPYETDDLALLEQVVSLYGDWLQVDGDEDDTAARAKAEAKAIKELHRAQDKAEAQHATKDPLEPAAEVPSTVADLVETTEEKKTTSKGGKS